MNILSRIHKAAQQSKIFRYKTYKLIGCVGYRKQLDQSFLVLMVFLLVVGGYFIVKPDSESPDILNCAPNCPTSGNESIANPDAQEVVHSDFGDDPVIEDENRAPTLDDLEDLVRQKKAKIKTLSLNKNETLAQLLKRINLAQNNQTGTIAALNSVINLKTIRSQTPVIVFLNVQDDAFMGLSIPITEKEFVGVIKNESGEFIPIMEEASVETKNMRIKGKIERTFSGSTQKAGLPKEIAVQIINALGNELNLTGGLRKGDSFDIIYSRKVTSGGLELDSGRQALYVGITKGNKSEHRYWYTDKSGTPAFYNPLGQRGQTTLEKRPVKAVPRLSSPYGWRMHPVLMYRVFHSGVDLACPSGTPIYAGGDGKIVHLGRKGAYGKYIKIQHAGGYATAYAHMNAYKAGLKAGSIVKRGEIIGYVGATGRVTGPHLHYEVWKNGKTTNPFNNNVISGKQLTGFELEQFQSFAESINPDFQKHLFGKFPPVPGLKPTPPATKSAKK